jgi:hypothetical protein
VSRRSPRFRVQLTVTVAPMIAGGEMAVCQTRDVSDVGMWLETSVSFDLGIRLVIQTMDQARGSVVEVIGEVTRQTATGLGIRVIEPPVEWRALVASAARRTGRGPDKPTKRLRVLVVGDDQRQRGALALYVTSGWDVRFACDLDTTDEALRGVRLDAVIAEHDAADGRWQPILAAARQTQPAARRIVRGSVAGAPDADPTLVHRFVDRDAGLDALLDALTADIAQPS